MDTKLSYVTISVANIPKAKQFYEGVLGFKPTLVYKPTEWYAYDMGTVSGGFAITQATEPKGTPSVRQDQIMHIGTMGQKVPDPYARSTNTNPQRHYLPRSQRHPPNPRNKPLP